MHLMLLTQSSWASVRVLMCLDEMGSNSRTSVCSQATVRTDLSRTHKNETSVVLATRNPRFMDNFLKRCNSIYKLM